MNPADQERPYEEKHIRCPKLGGQVSFEYCSVERQHLPCNKALTCWSPFFDVEKFFREKFTEEEFMNCFFAPPQPKLVTLIELIENTKKLCKKNNHDDLRS